MIATTNHHHGPREFIFSREQYMRLVRGEKHMTVRKGIRTVEPGRHIARMKNTPRQALLEVSHATHCRVRDLTIAEAVAEGYDNVETLRRTLDLIYANNDQGGLSDDDWVTLVYIQEVIWHD